MKKSKTLYSCGVIISILIIVAVLIFLIFQKNSNKQLNTVVEIIAEDGNENTELASTSEDKSIEEVEKENKSSEFSEIKNADKQTESATPNQINKNNESNNTTKEPEPIADPTFIMPVEGEILRDYAKDKLVYSDTLKEWVTHLAIDIKAPKTSVVKSSAPGTVTAIKNDPRFGLSVVIQHTNGYSTIYSNLLTAEFITVGEEVNQGETIGTVGNTAAFEILDEPHLHFEILKDGIQIDPNMYL